MPRQKQGKVARGLGLVEVRSGWHLGDWGGSLASSLHKTRAAHRGSAGDTCCWNGWLGNWGDVPKEPLWRKTSPRGEGQDIAAVCSLWIKAALRAETYLFLNLLIAVLIKPLFPITPITRHCNRPAEILAPLIVIFISFRIISHISPQIIHALRVSF